MSRRTIGVGVGVTFLHLGALCALHAGLLQRTTESTVPAALVAEVTAPPAPPAPTQPPTPRPPQPRPQPKFAVKSPPLSPRPQPVPTAREPSATAETTADVAPQAPAATPAVPAPPAPPAPPRIELPSSQAAYLNNPAPQYPPLSKRLGETGQVLVRVLIGADGQPRRAELKRSSGFDRLDRAALDYVLKCRYVPGKVAGVAQAMWHDAPVNFILE